MVASAAPAHAASPEEPPPPHFDWGNGYKNPGASCDSLCVPKQSYGVPVVVTNPTDEDFYIQFFTYILGGTNYGVYGITAGVATGAAPCPPLSGQCTIVAGPCATTYGLSSTNTVCIPANTINPVTLYVTSVSKGNSSQTDQRIDYRWIRKSDCEVTLTSYAYSAESPPTDLC
jgi:hypothetical protein